MQSRSNKFIGLLLAALLFASSLAPASAWAEVTMRCAGAFSAPCGRLELPAPGLSSRRVTGALMACCRAGKTAGTAMPGCSMQRMHGSVMASPKPVSARSAVLPVQCLVSIRELAPAPASPAQQSKWLLSSPALAPPPAAAVSDPCAVPVRRWPYMAAYPPHTAPSLHGLRAPPA